ncbi:MAG: BON domain-containing protein [Steroidobacteraceae bacterium]
MMIKQALVAAIAGVAFAGGLAFAEEKALDQQVAQAPTTGKETVVEKIDDAALTGKVKAALIANADTKAYQINVETQQGVVRLLGAVDNAKAKTAASTVAMSVKGVKEVKNELTLKGT